MTISGFSTMFNRLPLYSRPKEPAIGHPVLTESSNARLTGGVQTAGALDFGLDRVWPARGASKAFDTGKGLPQIPRENTLPPPRVDSLPPSRNASPAPSSLYREPSPLSVDERVGTPPGSRHRINRKPAPAAVPRTPSPANPPVHETDNTVTISAAPAKGATLAPATPPRQRRSSAAGLLQKVATSVSPSSIAAAAAAPAQPAPSRIGFTFGALVKEKVTGRRKVSFTTDAQRPPPPPSQSPQPPLPPEKPRARGPSSSHHSSNNNGSTYNNSSSNSHDSKGSDKDEIDFDTIEALPVRRPANLVSIDDWLDERQGLHRRSNTVSTVATRHSPATAPPAARTLPSRNPAKLQIRQSTFAPLAPPAELTSTDAAAQPMPAIPDAYLASPKAERRAKSARQHSDDRDIGKQVEHEREKEERERDEKEKEWVDDAAPQRPANYEQLDHLSQLEFDKELLEHQARQLRRQIGLLQREPASPGREGRAAKQQRAHVLEEKLADVEKEGHETGMKLYRAYRRRDKRDGYEGPTHLWVSRVTAGNA